MSTIDLSVSWKEFLSLFVPLATLRSGCHELAYVIATGEDPEATPGWQRSTTLTDYHELDLFARLGVRTMPAGFGLLLAELFARPFLVQPTHQFGTGPEYATILASVSTVGLIAFAYATLLWAIFIAYDLICGLLNVLGGTRR